MTIRGRHPNYIDARGETDDRAKPRPPGPDTSHLRPNFEGIGMDEDPDAYDRERDRRLERR